MLLRRVIDHVREQNWFAVGIDFVIVVVGVYIGIEVANWNDARRDRVAEALYLDRLDSEIAALATSHIFAGTISYPPTIKELIATGRILLIRDDAIRTAILAFDQTHAELSQLRTDIQIDRRLLARQYPGLIGLGFSSWEDGACNFPAMAGNRTFLNDFIDNMRRYDAYASQVTGRQAEILSSLGLAVVSGSPGRPLNAAAQNASEKRP